MSWANALVAVVGGGVAGGALSSVIQIRASTRAEWRNRLLGAAEDFSRTYWSTSQPLWAILDQLYKKHGELPNGIDLSSPARTHLREAETQIHEVVVQLARLHLLFGPGEVVDAARESRQRLRRAFNELDPQPDYPYSDAARAQEEMARAEESHDRFALTARRAARRAR